MFIHIILNKTYKKKLRDKNDLLLNKKNPISYKIAVVLKFQYGYVIG